MLAVYISFEHVTGLLYTSKQSSDTIILENGIIVQYHTGHTDSNVLRPSVRRISFWHCLRSFKSRHFTYDLHRVAIITCPTELPVRMLEYAK